MIRPGLFTGIIVSAVIVSAVLFQRKFAGETTRLDEIKNALGYIRSTLTKTSVIGCVSYTKLPETASQVANALVPATIVSNAKSLDTMLYIFNSDVVFKYISSFR